MTTMLELIGVLHDIDRIKGRVCGACQHFSWQLMSGWKVHHCARGMEPLGAEDGCGLFSTRSANVGRAA